MRKIVVVFTLLGQAIYSNGQTLGSGSTSVTQKKIYLSNGYTSKGADQHVLYYSVGFHHYEPIAQATYVDITFPINTSGPFCIIDSTGKKNCNLTIDKSKPSWPSIALISFSIDVYLENAYMGRLDIYNQEVSIDGLGGPVRVALNNIPLLALNNKDGKFKYASIEEYAGKIKVNNFLVNEVTYSSNVLDYLNSLARYDAEQAKLSPLKKQLEEAERNGSIESRLQIVKQIKAIVPNDYSNNQTYAQLQSKMAEKEELYKQLNTISPTDLKEILSIRQKITRVDRNDVENNFNIKTLENKIASNEEKARKEANDAFEKKMYNASVQQSSTTPATTTYYTPQSQIKTTDQIINEAAGKIAGILLQAKADRDAYKEEQKLNEEREAERREEETRALQQQSWDRGMARLEKANNNPADARAWESAFKMNTQKSYGDYLDRFGNRAVYADVASVFYAAWSDSKESLDEKIEWAVSWENWKLVLHLVDLGANPTVEWYLSNRVFDDNITKRITSSHYNVNKLGLSQLQLTAYLVTKGLDFNKGNIFYQILPILDKDYDMSLLNALVEAGNLSAEYRAQYFVAVFRDAFAYDPKIAAERNLNITDIINYYRFKNAKKNGSGIYQESRSAEVENIELSSQHLEEYRNFYMQYLSRLINELPPDKFRVIAIETQLWHLNVIETLFSLPTAQHLKLLNFLSNIGFTIEHFETKKEDFYWNFSGAGDVKDIDPEILHKYLELGLNPTSNVFHPGKSSLLKRWKEYKRSDLIDLWENFKDEQKAAKQ